MDFDYLQKGYVVDLDTCKYVEAISFSFYLPAIEVPWEYCIATSINGGTMFVGATSV